MSGKQKGMVQIWNVVGFDEVADLQKMPKEVITTMKTYREPGQFQRGPESMAGYASIAMFGKPRAAIGKYLNFYNSKRPHSSLYRQTPDQAYFDLLKPIPEAA